MSAVWWYPRVVVEKTYWVLAVVVFMVLLLAAIPIMLGHAAMSEDSNYDWIISTADSSIHMDAVRSAREQAAPENFGQQDRRQLQEVPEDRLNRREWVGDIAMRYRSADGSNLFTAPKLKTICDVENLLMKHVGGKNERTRTKDIPDVPSPSYTSICRLDRPECAGEFRDGSPIILSEYPETESCAQVPDTKCKGQFDESGGSVMAFFFPANDDGSWACADPLDLDTQVALLTATDTLPQLGWFLGRDVSTGSTSRLRSQMHMAGHPFVGDGGDNWEREDNEPRRQALGPLGAELEKEFFDYFGMSAWTDESVKNGVDIIFWSDELAGHEFFNDMISSDLSYAFGSIMFVLLVMCVHSKSFFLGGLGMIQVLTSLPIALFFYRTVFGISFITQMHILSIYLVLGIGADDLFVFYDAWIQSEFEPSHNADLVSRMDYTYKRAAGAMLTTSFTTCIAFIATAISPLMPLSAFGLFASFAVFLNYVLVMLVFPLLVIIWETGGRKSCCCCNLPCCGGHPAHQISVQATVVTPKPPVSEPTKEVADAASHPTVPEDLDHMSVDHLRNLEKCFVLCYTPCMRGPYRFVSVFLVGVSFIVMGIFAFQLSPPTKQERWFPDDHMVQRLMDSNVDYFGGDVVEYTTVDITWGLSGIDRDATGPEGEVYSRWEPQYRGQAAFDNSFSALGSEAVHRFFWETGKILETKACDAIGCMDGTNKLVRPLNDGNGHLGMDGRAIESFYVAWRRWYSNSKACLPSAPCAAQIAGTCTGLSKQLCQGQSENCFWAADTCLPLASFDEVPDGHSFIDSLQEFRQEQGGWPWNEKVGFINGELKFLTISVTTTLEKDQPQDRVVSVVDVFEDFVSERNSAAPAGLQGAIYSAPRGDFAWASTQQGLVDNVFNGFKIVFPAAFLTLMVATRNWIVSMYAICTIAGIVAQVLGMCQAVFGWELGISESIAAVIVIGFAVDFTVHLAHMYVDSGAPTRGEKMAHSARTMGLTVVMGGITTMGAGLFMWFCVVTFFTKFCILIVSTIAFSLNAALFFFMPLIAIIGPAGNQGSLRACCAIKPKAEATAQNEQSQAPSSVVPGEKETSEP